MDGAEEALKVKLQKLEKLAFDPMVSGRQEEIWARMGVLRERAQLLKTETDKLAKDAAAAGGEGSLDEEQMKKVEKVRLTALFRISANIPRY
jgi:nuclear pore complex protein Nup54